MYILSIYATANGGDGVPYKIKEMEVETCEFDLPSELFRDDVVLSVVITSVEEDLTQTD